MVYSIEKRMSSVKSYRPKNVPNSKWMQNEFENTAALLHSKHCCSFYSLTLRLVPIGGQSISSEWVQLGKLVPKILNCLTDKYLMAGVIVGIEMSRKDPRRVSKLAGRPHLHVFLATYNDFLQPSRFEVRSALTGLADLDVQLNALPTGASRIGKDVVRAMIYPTKDGKDELVQEAAKHYWNCTSVQTFVNTSLDNNHLLGLSENLIARGYGLTLHSLAVGGVPSVPRYSNNPMGSKLQMATFIRNVCLKQGMAWHKDNLWTIQSPSRYTWTKSMPVSQFGVLLGDLSLPVDYLMKFHEGAAWALKEGSDKKLGSTVSVFPKLVFMPNMYEYSDGLYDMYTGSFTTNHRPFTSANMFIGCSFDAMVYPEKLLAFLAKLVKNEKTMHVLLVSLGGLFHDVENRKLAPALWLHGKNSTYKSWFVNNFLAMNFVDELIHTLDRHSSRFRFSPLRDVENGVVLSDDFRSEDFSKNSGELLNLLDGESLTIDKKYGDAIKLRYKGNWALTTNESFGDTVWSSMDRKSLAARFNSVEFQLDDSFVALSDVVLKDLMVEFQSLGLLANSYFIKQRYGRDCMLPSSWKHFPQLEG